MRILSHIEADKIFSKGKILDAWPCDANEKGEFESNGGEEMLVEKDRKLYIFTGKYNQSSNSGVVYNKVFGGQRQVELDELPKDVALKLLNSSNDK